LFIKTEFNILRFRKLREIFLNTNFTDDAKGMAFLAAAGKVPPGVYDTT
jgi:hypothetical protein